MKKTLAISVDEERYKELTLSAEKSKMTRTRYVNMLLDKAEFVDAPIEVLLLNDLYQKINTMKITKDDKNKLLDSVNEIVRLKLKETRD